MKKLAILTPVIPYPLDEGGKVSQYVFLEYLQDFIEIHLILRASNSIELNNINELGLKLPKIKIHIIKEFSENENIKSNKSNLLFIKKQYWKIHDLIYSKKQCNNQKYSNLILTDFDRKIDFLNVMDRKIGDQISKILEMINPDLVQVEHNPYLNLGDFLFQYKKIFVEHEIQFARLTSFKSKLLTTYEEYKINLNRTFEVTLLNKYDALFVFSDNDKFVLENNGVNVPIFSTPFPVSDIALKSSEVNENIEKMVFVGGTSHLPNKEAIIWFIEKVLDEIFKITNLKLHIIGKCDSEIINRFSNKESVVFEGYVEDLYGACKKSIMIVPLKMGSGIRTKILYGMAQKLPIVSTSIGAEGIEVTNNENILIADDKDEFIEAILRLLENQNLVKYISKNGFEFVKSKYSQKYLSEKRLKIYNNILNA